ncbi:hypothetical protein ABT341_23535 [Pseudonocardia alni]|jgi:hypothetical protein|uniref:hypothetical protein n=1 Tax=Pseudonocardia alni TaxID=33907 RepID=UPI0033289B1D
MAPGSEVHGPWRIEGVHPDDPEHVGSVVSMDADGEVDPTGESVLAASRRAVCSCGWSGPSHTPPPSSEPSLIVRRYRKQSREVLAPEWRAHVAQWVPAPLDGSGGGEDAPAPRRKRQRRAQAPEPCSPTEVVVPTVPEPANAVEPVVEVPVPGTQAVPTEGAAAPVAERPADSAEALGVAAERARVAAAAAARATDELTEAVRAARADGVSWRRVGSLVGITGQAAHERWRSA